MTENMFPTFFPAWTHAHMNIHTSMQIVLNECTLYNNEPVLLIVYLHEIQNLDYGRGFTSYHI